jgi:hypothetical protein
MVWAVVMIKPWVTQIGSRLSSLLPGFAFFREYTKSFVCIKKLNKVLSIGWDLNNKLKKYSRSFCSSFCHNLDVNLLSHIYCMSCSSWYVSIFIMVDDNIYFWKLFKSSGFVFSGLTNNKLNLYPSIIFWWFDEFNFFR